MSLVMLALGVAVLAAAWSGPLRGLLPGPFSAHMGAHMAVVAVASPLLAAACAGRRFDPAVSAPALFAPIPAAIAELVAVWSWHVPLLHEAARTRTSMFVAEQATFLGAGLLLWIAAIGGTRAAAAGRGAAGVVALIFTSTHMTLLGALFALTPRPLYAHALHAEPAALFDQHMGGVIMLLVGGASYMAGGLWLTSRLLHGRTAPAGAAT
jgi:putative membrane protein